MDAEERLTAPRCWQEPTPRCDLGSKPRNLGAMACCHVPQASSADRMSASESTSTGRYGSSSSSSSDDASVEDAFLERNYTTQPGTPEKVTLVMALNYGRDSGGDLAVRPAKDKTECLRKYDALLRTSTEARTSGGQRAGEGRREVDKTASSVRFPRQWNKFRLFDELPASSRYSLQTAFAASTPARHVSGQDKTVWNQRTEWREFAWWQRNKL